MLKNSFLTLAILFATSIVTYSQETTGVTKNLSFYMCGGTGNINPDAGAVLGAHGEMGLTFDQNFANAQWLNISTTVAICTEAGGLLRDPKNLDKFVGAPDTDDNIVGYGLVNFGFGKHVTVGLHTTGRLDLALQYRLALPANQRLTFKTYMEILPAGNSLYATPDNIAYVGLDDDGKPEFGNTSRILNHLDFRLTYAVAFNPEWTYEMDTRFRFNGASYAGEKADSAEALKNSFSVRWNNTFYYSNPNGFGGYLQFRYQPARILTSNVKHAVHLLAGISYSYDLSAL